MIRESDTESGTITLSFSTPTPDYINDPKKRIIIRAREMGVQREYSAGIARALIF